MKNELQTLRLFSPLFPHIYRRNEWGDYENEPEDLTASEILEYENIILDRVEKEKLPDEGERGLAVYLDDALSEKIHSIHPSVEDGELFVSFWDASDHFFIKPEDEMDFQSSGFGMTIGGMR